MTNLLLKQLIDFGLSEKEGKIYLTLLELEAATVFEVAKQSGVNRSSAYVVLEALKKKGLVGISDDKKVSRYIAASPEALLYTAKSATKKQKDIKTGIESVLPELKALHKGTRGKPIVKIFEGQIGLINALEDSLISKEKFLRAVSSLEKVSKLLPPDYFFGYISRRTEKGIKMHGIHPANDIARKLVKASLHKLDTPLLIPEKKYTTPADLAIYDNKIGYLSSENGGFAVIIESKEMAEVMKSVFDLAWEEAKRLNKMLR
jgi:sugar-specific transcriptional regulator TrmB